jgi:hypothetical protein
MKAVKAEFPSRLKDVDAPDIQLFQSAESVDRAIELDALVTELAPTSFRNPMIVIVPTPGNSIDIVRSHSPTLVVPGKLYDWNIVCGIFSKLSPVTVEKVSFTSQTRSNLSTKQLDLFHVDKVPLIFKRIADLQYQDINIDSPIEKEIARFMDSGSFLGLLIGPTGCGKTHQLLQMAKKQFTIYMDAGDLSDAKFGDDSTKALSTDVASVCKSWSKANHNLDELRRLARAFVLSRLFLLKYLKEIPSELSPKDFLLHQILNAAVVDFSTTT